MEQTDPRELLKNIAGIFEKLKLPYSVTGGMAVLIWGRPRFTADIDIVIEIKPSDVKGLVQALMDLSKSGYIDEDIANEIVRRGGEFNFIDGPTGVKVDFWVSDNGEFDLSRLKRRVAKEILGQKIYFVSPEDLILSKLRWFKESRSNRHLEDAESVLKISGDNLDKNYLAVWANKLGIRDELGKLGM
ncbi:nucleotidyl transferase AbiEii/AbiGii toxin family protein [Candidatus Peregrinibacteria bacterium]|nr:nucleotidyl transferase AbiEii/AbiGii toxin family protein [Candidatus Peregrinibacteria bacterium]